MQVKQDKRLVEQARKPSNESILLGVTLGTLESDPLFVKNLHVPKIEPCSHDVHTGCINAGYTRLEHSRKPSNESILLGVTLGTLEDPLFVTNLHVSRILRCELEAEPFFVEHLHGSHILHPHDTLVQLLSIGGPCKF